jgi:hypothetical protein
MFKDIAGLPQDVLAIEATGKITHGDYHDTLIHRAEAMMAKGPIKMLYVIGKEFSGFELEALWDDGALSTRSAMRFGGSCNWPLAGRALKRRIRSALKSSDRRRFRARTDRLAMVAGDDDCSTPPHKTTLS